MGPVVGLAAATRARKRRLHVPKLGTKPRCHVDLVAADVTQVTHHDHKLVAGLNAVNRGHHRIII